ncbi:MAG: cytochrome c-type biogenesis protein [Candidatus Methylomirabilales bacterium]
MKLKPRVGGKSLPVLTSALAGIVAAAAIVAALARGPEAPATVEERVQVVASGLRCPVCRNLSVADSPSQLAGEMRATIELKLREGESPQEIRRYFVASYGEWILLAPERRGIGWLPWAAPAIFLVTGAILVRLLLLRRRRQPSAEVGESERAWIEQELELLEDPQ